MALQQALKKQAYFPFFHKFNWIFFEILPNSGILQHFYEFLPVFWGWIFSQKSLEGVWYEVDCKVTDSSYQTPSKLITILTKNSPSGVQHPNAGRNTKQNVSKLYFILIALYESSGRTCSPRSSSWVTLALIFSQLF